MGGGLEWGGLGRGGVTVQISIQYSWMETYAEAATRRLGQLSAVLELSTGGNDCLSSNQDPSRRLCRAIW